MGCRRVTRTRITTQCDLCHSGGKYRLYIEKISWASNLELESGQLLGGKDVKVEVQRIKSYYVEGLDVGGAFLIKISCVKTWR